MPRNMVAPYEMRSSEVRGKVTSPVKRGAKHRWRGFMPRNTVAPYEEHSDEVRGKGVVIKYLRLEDAKYIHSRLSDGRLDV